MNLDIQKIKSVHFVGIKGVAMTALAIIADEMGIKVTGSDTAEEFPTDYTLSKYNITPQIGFLPQHILDSTELVIYTGAHSGAKNPEVIEATKRGIAVLSHGKALGMFMKSKRAISVAGSHGKTTTSALIASTLMFTGYDPSFAIGCGEILDLKTSAHFGSGEWFVAEADEYVTDPNLDKTPRFLWQHPEILLITNIDFDHPDVYENIAEIVDAFLSLIKQMPENGTVILNIDDPYSRAILSKIDRKIITYGTSSQADYQLTNMRFLTGETQFEIKKKGNNFGNFTIKIPGSHNCLNATGAAAVLDLMGVSVVDSVAGFENFIGTKRRFELKINKNDKLLFDDYAHHPAEITASITAAREWYPRRRIVAIFQPHTYSRTSILMEDFAKSLATADCVVICEIYASAREAPNSEVSGKILYENVKKVQKDAHYAPNKEAMLQYIQSNSFKNDLILVMGAGDIYTWLSDLEKVL